MAKIEYFMAYISYLDAIEPLGDAERGRLFTALLQYAKSGEVPQLNGNEKFLFPMMKSQIDRDNAKYAEKCERNRQSAYQRTAANDSECKQTQANAAKGKENTKEKENNTHSNECVTRTRAKKNKYGEYGHVLLSDTDYQKLHDEYSNADEAIAFLDEYIEYKGYTAKNHYLAMEKWVFDALAERKEDKPNASSGSFETDDFFRASMERSYD